MGMGADVDPAAAAMMGGGAGGMGMDTSGMQGLGGPSGLGNLPRGLGRSGLPAGLGMSGGQRPSDFSDPALQGALSRPLAPLEPN